MSREMLPDPCQKGVIAWMVNNRVTPNLIMLMLLIGGGVFMSRITQDVFPEFSMDVVNIRVPYPGASPEEVEQGIILAIEEAVRAVDGIKEMTATASEGSASVSIELLEGADVQSVYQDVKQQVDRITTLPLDAEEAQVSLAGRRREVMRIQLYGDVGEWSLRELAEQVRDALLNEPGITQVDLEGARNHELKVLIDRETLRMYGLTLSGVAARIRQASVELPGGFIETSGGEILLRVRDRREWASQFAQIPVVTTPAGTVLYLGDIAAVSDDFEETNVLGLYDGSRAIGVNIYRVGDQTPIGVTTAALQAMERIQYDLPQGVRWTVSNNASDRYKERLSLLLKNAAVGLVLVIVLLGLFLEFKLALWVMMGIPISFVGAFLLLPSFDVSINMISIFAFIVALGIVVDDAIVVGENVYEYRTRGMGSIQAAILGTQDVAVPVVFSIVTNIVAFMPLLFLPGTMGKIWIVIPAVVITIFVISMIESLLILPAHLAHARRTSGNRLSQAIHRGQQAFSRGFVRFVEVAFAPLLDWFIRLRYLTVGAGIAVFILVLGYVISGRIPMINMPRVESDYAVMTATLPYGSPMERVRQVSDKLAADGRAVAEENGGQTLMQGIFTSIRNNVAEVRIYLTDANTRPISTSALTRLWRERVGQIPGLQSLQAEADRGGPGSGAAISIELSHRNIAQLEHAGERLAALLDEFPNVKDISSGYTPGKQQLDFSVRNEGLSLGLTSSDIARQVRDSFHGADALRQQRGRNEVRVRVKLPLEQRSSEYDIENLLIRTPAGTYVPLMDVADVSRGRAYTSISRRNGRRTLTVTANVEPIADSGKVIQTLNTDILPALANDIPGLTHSWRGRQADMADSMKSLMVGFLIAMLGIFAMLAIPFRSYTQPVIVMFAIPFGLVGAVLGHMIMDYPITIMSIMGVVALSGVVINGSLLLINYANVLVRNEGMGVYEAIHQAGIRRFRPIVLTTLTTFGGLAPMIFETSRAARFMIPMAISLGFGILFSTAVTLVLVPCLYMMLDDAHRLVERFRSPDELEEPMPQAVTAQQ